MKALIAVALLFAMLSTCSGHNDVKQTCFSGNCSDGQGMMIWYTIVYKGDFKNGKMHGNGIMTWSEGKKYSGEWQNGVMQGKGLLEWNDGARYQGDFKNNKRHGKGSYSREDRVYEGQWADDKMHGRGTLRFSNGQVLEGVFEADVYKGPVR